MSYIYMTNHTTGDTTFIVACPSCKAQDIFKALYEAAQALSTCVCLSFAIVPAPLEVAR